MISSPSFFARRHQVKPVSILPSRPHLFRALGSLTFAMTQWITLRQWARRNGQTQTVENCDKWIADCQARGQRINNLAVAATKEVA